jgi:hypothetical protein
MMLRRGIPDGDFLVVDQPNVGIPSEFKQNKPNYILLSKSRNTFILLPNKQSGLFVFN